MANFKSNAGRRRFLGLQNKKKYAVGGLGVSPMYGDNTIPQTSSSSLVYQQSSPEYQAELADQLNTIETDTSYQENAVNTINRQNKIEGYGMRAGKMGLNKLADMAPDDFVGPDMGKKPGELLRSGYDAFKNQRNLNQIAQGGNKAIKLINKSDDVGQLLQGLGTYGQGAKATSSAVKAGTGAIKSGLGVGTVGALMAAGGDKLYDHVDDDDATTLTGKEAGASALRGAGAGIGAIGTASAIGATVLPGMFAAGAANAWNPIGWATLAAAGIGAGITAINRKRKANKAGDAMDAADAAQAKDVARVNRLQRLDTLRDKQYSGFNYGGDTQGPGFYKSGGVRKFHTGGTADSDHAMWMQTDPSVYEQHMANHGGGETEGGGDMYGDTEVDEFGQPIPPGIDYGVSWGNQSGFKPVISGKGMGKIADWGKEQWQNSSTLGKVGMGALATVGAGAGVGYLGANPDQFNTMKESFFGRRGGVKGRRKYQSEGLLDRYGLPRDQNLYGGNVTASENTRPAGYTLPVLNEQMPLLDPEYITDVNGTKVDTRNTTSVSQDNTPAGYTHGKSGTLYAEDSIPNYEKPGYVPQGVPPNAAFMMPQGTAGDPLLQETILRNPMTNPSAPIAAGLAMFGPGAAGGAFSNPVSTMGVRGSQHLSNAIMNPQGLNTMARLGQGAKGTYNLYGASLVPKAVSGIAGGVSDEFSGDASLSTRLGMAEDLINLNPTSSLLRRTAFGGLNVGEGTKIAEDFVTGDYLSGLTRTGVSMIPGDQQNLDVGKYTTKIANKYLKKDASDSILKSSANLLSQGSEKLRDIFGQDPKIVDTDILRGGRTSNPSISSQPFLRAGGMRNLPGGQAIDIGNGATKYIGQTHAQGGIMADPQSEVESNEIEKDVTLADGTTNPYIFSEYLNTDGSKGYNDGGESIADVAEGLATSGAPQSEFDELARMQELQAGRSGNKIMDTTMAKYGGLKYQDKGVKKVPDTNVLGDDFNPFNAAKRLYYDYLAGEGAQSDQAGNILRLMVSPASTVSMGLASAAYPFMSEEQQGKHEEMIGQHRKATKDLDKYKQTLIDERKYKTPWESIKGVVGYKEGGVRNYQTRGLVMSQDRQDQYDRFIKFIPGTGYVGPDGNLISENEADVVDWVNRGGLDSYNPNQGDNYMPSTESLSRDALRGSNQNQPVPTNEAVANPNFRRGHQGDLVVPSNTTPTTINPGNQDFNAITALGNAQIAEQQAAIDAQTQAAEAEIDRIQEEGRQREAREAQEAAASSIPAVGTEARRQYYDDNNWAYDNTIPGFEEVGLTEDEAVARANAGGDPLRTTTSSVMSQPAVKGSKGKGPLYNNPLVRAALGSFGETFNGEVEEVNADVVLDTDGDRSGDPTKGKGKDRGSRRYDDKTASSRLLKAAQFIPAAMAFMDKPDYMEEPNKVGNINRVNLQNVSLSDRQAAIKSDNAAMQRFISNAGMGSAGFAARMAGWQKKESLAAAVTAEQRRMNTEINNREATMNVDIEARNRANQSENINRSMQVDQFNKESRAATNAQKTSAVANATLGLLTYDMDNQRIAADDRRTAAIAGQTGVMNREGYGLQTDRHFKGTGVTSQDQEYWDYYDNLANTEKKKFGGMRKIPGYGYSTK